LPLPWMRLAGPLSWGANLWLLLIGWPMVMQNTIGTGPAIVAATPLVVATALARAGLLAVASACFLVAFPVAIAGVLAMQEPAIDPPSALVLATIALGIWVYGAAVSRALRPIVVESGTAVRIEPLQGRGRNARLYAARKRAARVRSAAVVITVTGAFAIVIAAPSAGEPDQLHRAFGDDPRHAGVLVAMVAAAIGVGVVSVFTTALLRPPTAEDHRPFAPGRAAAGLLIALAGAATYYVLRG